MILFFIPFILIILQGLFTATETAVMSIERSRLGRAILEKKHWASRTRKFLDKPDRFFSTILICEDLLLVVASTFFAQFFIFRWGSNWVILSTVILSLFSLVIGQYIPKAIALTIPETALVMLSDLIYTLEFVLTPVVIVFSAIARGIGLILGIKKRTDIIRHSDIVFAMTEYEKETSKLASRLFNFSHRVISDVMIPLDAAHMCKQGEEKSVISEKPDRVFTRWPVFSDKPGDIIGIFNIKDYIYTDKAATRPPYYVKADERCMTVFMTMKEKGEHMAIVRGSDGSVNGIVTLEDLIEELVGEIRDEK
ncbi:MAG TPA: CNNM domain-containing protein [bacterium]